MLSAEANRRHSPLLSSLLFVVRGDTETPLAAPQTCAARPASALLTSPAPRGETSPRALPSQIPSLLTGTTPPMSTSLTRPRGGAPRGGPGGKRPPSMAPSSVHYRLSWSATKHDRERWKRLLQLHNWRELGVKLQRSRSAVQRRELFSCFKWTAYLTKVIQTSISPVASRGLRQVHRLSSACRPTHLRLRPPVPSPATLTRAQRHIHESETNLP